MASDSPRSPKLLKGGLVVYQSQNPGPPLQVIIFQYKPGQLSRKDTSRGESVRTILHGAYGGLQEKV
jgi:hypothetical protein